jgi:hypothetical protein
LGGEAGPDSDLDPSSHALVLLRKASDDATASRKFANDPEIA